MRDPEELREYVRTLMKELERHSTSHPQVLKGEKVQAVQAETEKLKKKYEELAKKNNEVRVQVEAQKRLLSRI